MGIESYLQAVDKKTKRVDEMTSLKEILKQKEDKDAELTAAIKEMELRKYREANSRIKEIIISALKGRGFEIEVKGDLLKIEYKECLSFVVNLGDETRYISRSEGGQKNLGFRVVYRIDAQEFRPNRSVSASSEFELLRKKVEMVEEFIQYNAALIESLRGKNLIVVAEYDNKKIVELESMEQIVGIMFQ